MQLGDALSLGLTLVTALALFFSLYWHTRYSRARNQISILENKLSVAESIRSAGVDTAPDTNYRIMTKREPCTYHVIFRGRFENDSPGGSSIRHITATNCFEDKGFLCFVDDRGEGDLDIAVIAADLVQEYKTDRKVI